MFPYLGAYDQVDLYCSSAMGVEVEEKLNSSVSRFVTIATLFSLIKKRNRHYNANYQANTASNSPTKIKLEL